jgi:hypothetical protein
MRPARRRESADSGSSKPLAARKSVSFNNQIERAHTPEAPQGTGLWADVEVWVFASHTTANADMIPPESPRACTQVHPKYLRLPTLLQAQTIHKRESR